MRNARTKRKTGYTLERNIGICEEFSQTKVSQSVRERESVCVCIIVVVVVIIIIITTTTTTTTTLLAFTTHLRVLASSFLRFRDHTQGHTTVGRTPLDE
jgi:hypothetical protein